MMSGKVLVIGSEGTIGSPLCKRLKDDIGLLVFCCDRVRKKKDDYFMVDITHYETLTPIFESVEPEVVIHLAGEVSRETSEYWPNIAVDSNVIGTLNVIRHCLRYGSSIIFAGTSEEYGESCDENIVCEDLRGPARCRGIYGLTKWMAEELIEFYSRMHNLEALVAKIFMCYGPGEIPGPFRSAISRYIDWAIKGEDIIVHEGSARSWCYIDDIVEAFMKLINYMADFKERPRFEVFNVGRDESWTMKKLAELIICLTDSKSKIVIKKIPNSITPIKRASFNKIKEKIGWESETDLISGLKRTIDWQFDLLHYGGVKK